MLATSFACRFDLQIINTIMQKTIEENPVTALVTLEFYSVPTVVRTVRITRNEMAIISTAKTSNAGAALVLFL